MRFGDYRYGIPDANVMQKLGCTPQSWSRYTVNYLILSWTWSKEVREVKRDNQTGNKIWQKNSSMEDKKHWGQKIWKIMGTEKWLKMN